MTQTRSKFCGSTELDERSIKMKHLSTIIQAIGFCLLFLGGGAMDSASVFLPIVAMFSGVGIFAIGGQLREAWI